MSTIRVLSKTEWDIKMKDISKNMIRIAVDILIISISFYDIRLMARNFAERALGLSFISFLDGLIGDFVTSSNFFPLSSSFFLFLGRQESFRTISTSS